ncbi:MAG TPA: sensor histidine kinase [Clostridiaceae bacterium]|nr:sensor histidine kinase [Clostridiaceae bacterium]
MDILLILSKFSIILYVLIKYLIGETFHPMYTVLSILIYICINMAYYIINSKMIKKGVLILSMVLLTRGYLYVNRLFIILLPLNLYEFSIGLFPSHLCLISSALIAFLLDKSIVPEYILILLLSYLIFFTAKRAYFKIRTYKNQNDDMRGKIYRLYERIDANKGYEKQVKYTAQLEERNKISQKIHDSVGHTISGSIMQLEAAKILMDKDKESTLKMVQNSINVLRDGLESIREVLREIKPPKEQMGINRLKLMTDDFTAKTQIETILNINGKIDVINYTYWNIIIENTKESLTNVLKYANATKVQIRIDVLNKFIKVEVKDNGIGSYSIKKGLGLRGIEERVSNAKGKAIIDGSDGFSVITLLPIEGAK